MPKLIDLAGRRFGKLTVIQRDSSRKSLHPLWLCQCDCGRTTVSSGSNLREGGSQTCGCSHTGHPTHGKSHTKLFRVLAGIKFRCRNENAAGYKNYGGRGIKVCERWDKTENFFEDMGESYDEHVAKHGSKNTFIERIENDGDYEQGNCKWSTRREQNRNKRSNVYLTLGNRTMLLTDWVKETKISHSIITARLKRGWSVEKALTEPKRPVTPYEHWTHKRK